MRRTLAPLVATAATLMLLVTPAAASTLGWRVLRKGDHGRDVEILQRILTRKGIRPGAPDGIFGRSTKRAVKTFQRRRGLAADGVVGPLTVHGLALSWPIQTASIFGPGLFGNRTACGQTLRPGTRGIAHRSLPCGISVPVYHAGRLAIFHVVDRGPYARGVSVDLTSRAAADLHMRATDAVRVGY